MTHPRDKVYRFATADQWAAGSADGFLPVDRGEAAALVTAGEPLATPLAGAQRGDANALLAQDVDGALFWMRADGTVWRWQDNEAFRVGRISPDFARDARRFLWGQNFGWVLTETAVVRLDVSTGTRLGAFDDAIWNADAIVADICDGVIIVERNPGSGAVRLRRVRTDGRAQIINTALVSIGPLLAGRNVEEGGVFVVLRGDVGWHIARQPLDGGKAAVEAIQPPPKPGSALAAVTAGSAMVTDSTGNRVFSVGLGHIGPVQEPLTDDDCAIGRIRDLIWIADELVASTDVGLWTINSQHALASAQTATWVSPVLMSPPGEPQGWQRADLRMHLPAGGQVMISAHGFDTQSAAHDALDDVLTTDPATRTSAVMDPPSRHNGVGDMTCRHYLGDLVGKYLILRVQVTLPPCSGAARLDALNVLYPNRSLIEDLPAIYRDDPVSAGQMRRTLAGFQALVDEIDDAITAVTSRLDPKKTDALWSKFLLQWLGHGELSRLLPPKRQALLRRLPDIMRMRGTLPGLIGVMDVLAPGAYQIEDSGTMPDAWLLPISGDPAGARLGQATRVIHTDPMPLALGGCTKLGAHVLGEVCGGAAPPDCSADVTVRITGGPALEAQLRPFTDAIARVFAPAHTRLNFLFTDHVPANRLGFGPGLGSITLDESLSRALGQWELPDAGTRASPEVPAVLDHATLNGNLVLE